MKSIYENYHLHRKLQKRVISKNDFTYRSILFFLGKYGKKRQDILDIGCGVGTTSLFLGSEGKNVLGVDISKKGISIAKKNANNLGLNKFVKFEVLNFPARVPNRKFDLIVCSEVLEHITDDKKAVSQIKNLLNKNGIVIASSPSENAPLYKIGVLDKFDKEVGHLRRYSEKEFRKLFENSSLDILETKKTEGILRNFLFTNSFGGFLLKVLNKWPFSHIVSFIDDLSIPIFGESNIYLVAKKTR